MPRVAGTLQETSQRETGGSSRLCPKVGQSRAGTVQTEESVKVGGPKILPSTPLGISLQLLRFVALTLAALAFAALALAFAALALASARTFAVRSLAALGGMSTRGRGFALFGFTTGIPVRIAVVPLVVPMFLRKQRISATTPKYHTTQMEREIYHGSLLVVIIDGRRRVGVLLRGGTHDVLRVLLLKIDHSSPQSRHDEVMGQLENVGQQPHGITGIVQVPGIVQRSQACQGCVNHPNCLQSVLLVLR
jgi:hypothetical protein